MKAREQYKANFSLHPLFLKNGFLSSIMNARIEQRRDRKNIKEYLFHCQTEEEIVENLCYLLSKWRQEDNAKRLSRSILSPRFDLRRVSGLRPLIDAPIVPRKNVKKTKHFFVSCCDKKTIQSNRLAGFFIPDVVVYVPPYHCFARNVDIRVRNNRNGRNSSQSEIE